MAEQPWTTAAVFLTIVGWVVFVLGILAVVAKSGPLGVAGILSGILFVALGKVLNLLSEIAANTQR